MFSSCLTRNTYIILLGLPRGSSIRHLPLCLTVLLTYADSSFFPLSPFALSVSQSTYAFLSVCLQRENNELFGSLFHLQGIGLRACELWKAAAIVSNWPCCFCISCRRILCVCHSVKQLCDLCRACIQASEEQGGQPMAFISRIHRYYCGTLCGPSWCILQCVWSMDTRRSRMHSEF